MSNLWVTAVETTEPDEYITHHQLAGMYSGDFDAPMRDARRWIGHEYDQAVADHADCDRPPPGHSGNQYCQGLTDHGVHEKDVEFGGPEKYIAHLRDDIARNGIREPLTVRGGNVITEGHHRAFAAMDLKMDRVPVEHIR